MVLLRKRKALSRLSAMSALGLFAVDGDRRHALHYAAEHNAGSLISAMKQHADFREACSMTDRHGMLPFDYGMKFGSRLARRLEAPPRDPDCSIVFATQAFLKVKPALELRHPSNALESLLYLRRNAAMGLVPAGGHERAIDDLIEAVRVIRSQGGEIGERSFGDFMFFESKKLGHAFLDGVTQGEREIVRREIGLYVEDDNDATVAYGKWLSSSLLP